MKFQKGQKYIDRAGRVYECTDVNSMWANFYCPEHRYTSQTRLAALGGKTRGSNPDGDIVARVKQDKRSKP